MAHIKGKTAFEFRLEEPIADFESYEGSEKWITAVTLPSLNPAANLEPFFQVGNLDWNGKKHSLGDYILVFQVTGQHAVTAYEAFVLGDKENGDVIFEVLNKPVGDVLGEDHPLVTEYSQRITEYRAKLSTSSQEELARLLD